MENRRFYVRLDEAAYRNWRAIGVLEDLPTDEDVAKFLVTVYSSQKQGDGGGSSIRCIHCHCHLSLYCTACHCPSHLALPLHPHHPPPSLTSPPPPPSQQLSDTPGPLSAGTDADNSPVLDIARVSFEVKDEEDIIESLQDEGGDDVDLDVVKTELSASACDEPACAEPALTVHFAATARATRSQSLNASRTSDRASGKKSVSSHVRKASKRKVTFQKQKRLKGFKNETPVRSRPKRRKRTPKREPVDSDDGQESDYEHSDSEEDCDTAAQKPAHLGQKKRKPCASQDLEKGHILSAEERHSAQVHVYDQSFIDRHKLDDESLLDCSKLLKKPGRQVLVVKSVPEKRGRKQKKRTCKVRPPAAWENSSSEDTVDYEIGHSQSTRLSKKSVNGLEPMPPEDNSQLHQTADEKDDSNLDQCSNPEEDSPEKYPALKQILSRPKLEGLALDDDGNSEDRQPFRILVSGLKILPLLTSSGNPAHKFYTYFECAHCKKAFTHKRAFNSHVQGHIDRRIYKCSFCDRSFERPCAKTIHEKRHKHECEICGQKYLEYSMIKEHMKLHVLKCARCPFETSDFHAYKKHKSSCGLVKPTLQCEICGVRLKSQKALSFHIAAIHQNNRPYKCTSCDKSFVLQTKLNAHIRERHTEGGRRFHCDKCGYRAFHAHSLRIHQRCVHSNERPYKCPHCPSAFARKIYLTIHLRKHTGEKPHRCSECLQTFTQRPSLTRHMRTHHHAESALSKKLKDLQYAH